MRSRPKIARASSVRPAPTRPEIPRISPRLREKETSRRLAVSAGSFLRVSHWQPRAYSAELQETIRSEAESLDLWLKSL
ncbi:MAG: hypothetical protein AB1700_07685 [Bacillota bacterium]